MEILVVSALILLLFYSFSKLVLFYKLCKCVRLSTCLNGVRIQIQCTYTMCVTYYNRYKATSRLISKLVIPFEQSIAKAGLHWVYGLVMASIYENKFSITFWQVTPHDISSTVRLSHIIVIVVFFFVFNSEWILKSHQVDPKCLYTSCARLHVSGLSVIHYIVFLHNVFPSSVVYYLSSSELNASPGVCVCVGGALFCFFAWGISLYMQRLCHKSSLQGAHIHTIDSFYQECFY